VERRVLRLSIHTCARGRTLTYSILLQWLVARIMSNNVACILPPSGAIGAIDPYTWLISSLVIVAMYDCWCDNMRCYVFTVQCTVSTLPPTADLAAALARPLPLTGPSVAGRAATRHRTCPYLVRPRRGMVLLVQRIARTRAPCRK
jgi:hypothetical protein